MVSTFALSINVCIAIEIWAAKVASLPRKLTRTNSTNFDKNLVFVVMTCAIFGSFEFTKSIYQEACGVPRSAIEGSITNVFRGGKQFIC